MNKMEIDNLASKKLSRSERLKIRKQWNIENAKNPVCWFEFLKTKLT